MRIVKIVQDPESGKVGVQIREHEKYDIKEHLQLLMEFVGEEAFKNNESRKSYKELLTRLGECEKKLSEVSQGTKVD
jgi:hypothetical protein